MGLPELRTLSKDARVGSMTPSNFRRHFRPCSEETNEDSGVVRSSAEVICEDSAVGWRARWFNAVTEESNVGFGWATGALSNLSDVDAVLPVVWQPERSSLMLDRTPRARDGLSRVMMSLCELVFEDGARLCGNWLSESSSSSEASGRTTHEGTS